MNKREYDKEYHKTEKYKKYQKNYALTEKRKKSLKKYRQSTKGKAVAQKSSKKYRESDKGKLMTKTYNKSEKGKSVATKASKKYHQSEKGKRTTRVRDAGYRNLGFNELCENPYPKNVKVAYHHINDIDVVPIPFALHNSCAGNNISLQQHQELVLKWIKDNYPIKIAGVMV